MRDRGDTTERETFLRALRRLNIPPDFGLFAEACASAEMAVIADTPRRSGAVPGAGQRARSAARARAASKRDEKMDLLATVLRAYGPCTRSQLAHHSGIPINSVNSLVVSMRALAVEDARAVVTVGTRGTESVVWLRSQRADGDTYTNGDV